MPINSRAMSSPRQWPDLPGVLFAAIDGYVAPELLGWREFGLAIMMVVLGGAGTLYGPVLGAILYSMVEETLKSSTELSAFFSLFANTATAKWLGDIVANSWSMALGFFLIAAVLAAPKGVAGFIEKFAGEAKRARPKAIAPSSGERKARKRDAARGREFKARFRRPRRGERRFGAIPAEPGARHHRPQRRG